MRILTLIKQVPDSTAAIKPTADGSAIETKGVKFVMNPFDEFAVEQAVQLREQGLPVDEIVALAIGPEKASDILRPALAMGADRGLAIEDETLSVDDELFLAQLVAAAIAKQADAFDLILTGKNAIDMDAGQLGPALAELLDLPHIGAVVELEVSARGITTSHLKAARRIEGAIERMECTLPALITCEKGLVEPRYPSLPNLMKAKKKPVEILSAADLGLTPSAPGSMVTHFAAPAASAGCQFIEGAPAEMARELVRRLREEAKVI